MFSAGFSNANIKWTKEELNDCLQRAQRGLLDYARRSNEELRTFTLHRHISFDMLRELRLGLTATIRDLTIRRLTEEDENLQFTTLFDLPPELRNRIYHFYDLPFDRYLINPAKPPLAQTCRQLR